MKHTLFFYLPFLAIVLYPMEYEKIRFEESDPLLGHSDDGDTSPYEFDKTLRINGKQTKAMVFDPKDSNTLYSGSSDNIVRIWDINKNSYEELPKSGDTSTIAINADGTALATAGWSRSVTLFDITKKIMLKNLIVKENKHAIDNFANIVSCLAFSPKKNNILAAGLGGDHTVYGQKINTIALFNIENETQDTLTGSIRILRHIAINPHDTKTLVATSYRKVSFWDIEKKECMREMNNEESDDDCVHGIAFHPTENMFFTSKNQHPFVFCSQYIDVWDAQQQKVVEQIPLKGFGNGVAHVAISPNGKEIIATGWDRTQIFDLGTRKLRQRLPNKRSFFGGCACSSSVNRPQHNSPIYEVALSNDGKNLATRGGTIKIWNRD